MKTTKMLDQPTNWPDVGKMVVMLLAPIVLIWKFIVMWFKEREESRVNSIKVIVREVCDNLVEPIKDNLKELRDHTDSAIAGVHKRIDDVFKEIRK